MGDVSDYDFSTGDAGASHVYNQEAGQIRVGGYICIKDHPCKVSAVSTSKTGKHGHAKCNFTAIDIFTGKKYEDIIPSTHTAHVPNVSKKEYSLLNIDDGFCSVMDEEGTTRDDIRMPEDDMGRKVQALFDTGKAVTVSVLSAMGHEQIVDCKEDAETGK